MGRVLQNQHVTWPKSCRRTQPAALQTPKNASATEEDAVFFCIVSTQLSTSLSLSWSRKRATRLTDGECLGAANSSQLSSEWHSQVPAGTHGSCVRRSIQKLRGGLSRNNRPRAHIPSDTLQFNRVVLGVARPKLTAARRHSLAERKQK